MKKIIFFISAFIFLWFFFDGRGAVVLGPGIFAPDPPEQNTVGLSEPFLFKDYLITPMANFWVRAKVLSKRNYRWDEGSELSPMDLALGWGRMSDESVLKKIKISQLYRGYQYYTKEFPIPMREIGTHSANMHIIPKNSSIAAEINRARKGDIVEFSGYLVRVDRKDGWRQISSLTRTDTGYGSCEVVWVEDFRVES